MRPAALLEPLNIDTGRLDRDGRAFGPPPGRGHLTVFQAQFPRFRHPGQLLDGPRGPISAGDLPDLRGIPGRVRGQPPPVDGRAAFGQVDLPYLGQTGTHGFRKLAVRLGVGSTSALPVLSLRLATISAAVTVLLANYRPAPASPPRPPPKRRMRTVSRVTICSRIVLLFARRSTPNDPTGHSVPGSCSPGAWTQRIALAPSWASGFFHAEAI